jgi:hypothetical protein
MLAAATALAAHFHRGAYTSHFRGQVVTLSFERGGRFHMDGSDGKALVTGAYRATGHEITFNDSDGPLAAKGTPGRYGWKRTGDTLVFTRRQDPIIGRAAALTGSPWTLQK